MMMMMIIIIIIINRSFNGSTEHGESKNEIGQVSPVLQAMKALRESRGIALLCF
jgi:hypothetical protein